jgi:hypothetical protein
MSGVQRAGFPSLRPARAVVIIECDSAFMSVTRINVAGAWAVKRRSGGGGGHPTCSSFSALPAGVCLQMRLRPPRSASSAAAWPVVVAAAAPLSPSPPPSSSASPPSCRITAVRGAFSATGGAMLMAVQHGRLSRRQPPASCRSRPAHPHRDYARPDHLMRVWERS